MNIDSGKTSQYIDTIYNNSLSHNQIKDTITSKQGINIYIHKRAKLKFNYLKSYLQGDQKVSHNIHPRTQDNLIGDHR